MNKGLLKGLVLAAGLSSCIKAVPATFTPDIPLSTPSLETAIKRSQDCHETTAAPKAGDPFYCHFPYLQPDADRSDFTVTTDTIKVAQSQGWVRYVRETFDQKPADAIPEALGYRVVGASLGCLATPDEHQWPQYAVIRVGENLLGITNAYNGRISTVRQHTTIPPRPCPRTGSKRIVGE